jgi:hypothetical protein
MPFKLSLERTSVVLAVSFNQTAFYLQEEEAAPLPKTPKTSTKSKAGTLTIPKATPKPLAVVVRTKVVLAFVFVHDIEFRNWHRLHLHQSWSYIEVARQSKTGVVLSL